MSLFLEYVLYSLITSMPPKIIATTCIKIKKGKKGLPASPSSGIPSTMVITEKAT